MEKAKKVVENSKTTFDNVVEIIANRFKAHPMARGQTWAAHCIDALNVSSRAFTASLAILIHAFFPFLFQEWGYTTIRDLISECKTKRLSGRATAVHDHPLSGSVHEYNKSS